MRKKTQTKFVNVTTAADVLGMDYRTVLGYIDRGEIVARKLGSKTLIPIADFEKQFGVSLKGDRDVE